MSRYCIRLVPLGMWYCTWLFRQILPAVHWRPLIIPPPAYLPSLNYTPNSPLHCNSSGHRYISFQQVSLLLSCFEPSTYQLLLLYLLPPFIVSSIRNVSRIVLALGMAHLWRLYMFSRYRELSYEQPESLCTRCLQLPSLEEFLQGH